MAIWAMLDNKGELMIGGSEPYNGKPLIAQNREHLEKYQDSLTYAEAKHMRLTELVPRSVTR